MTNYELAEALGRLVREERKITNEILALINVALERRAYLELGFSSMFDWLVRGFGYSNAAAYRRIEAARLLKSVPEAREKLEAGELNLSTLSKAQSMIKSHEKASGVKVSREMKQQIIHEIENKSAQQADQVLLALLPEATSDIHQTKRVALDESTTRYSMNFSNDMVEDIKRAKEVLSHKFPEGSDADILAYALKFLLDHTDPLREATSAAEAKRVTKAGAKRVTIKSSDGRCTYKDPVTGRVCASRYQVQMDHIYPKGLGGGDEAENLRLLCRKHNLMAAERIYGREHMQTFRRR